MDQDRTQRNLTEIFSADVVGFGRPMEKEAWTIQNLSDRDINLIKKVGIMKNDQEVDQWLL